MSESRKYEVKRQGLYDIMNGLVKWASSVTLRVTNRSSQLNARGKKSSSRRKSLLSKKGTPSGPGESAAVHFAQSSLLSFGDGSEKSDNGPAVVRTVESFSVVGSDAPTATQEVEARTVRGIPSR